MSAITVFQKEIEGLWQEFYAANKLEEELSIIRHMSRIEAQLWILDREEALMRNTIGMNAIRQGC